jgi:hypothetical protein
MGQVVALGIAAAVAAMWVIRQDDGFSDRLKGDIESIRSFIGFAFGSWALPVTLVAGLFLGAHLLRSLVIPPLAWDSLLYHLVRPALWIQESGIFEYNAGGKSTHWRLFPPLGNSLSGWNMVLVESDVLLPLVWFGVWSLLVLGASGGVGLAAVELGKAMGAHVIAAASTDAKLQVAKEAGADELLNYSNTDKPLKDMIKEMTGGKGVDVIYDPVGGDFTEQALRAMAWNGRHLIIGFAAGDIPKIPANLTLLKSCSVVGVFWGAFTQKEPQNHVQNMKELFQLHAEGKIKPKVSEVFAFEDYVKALDALSGRTATGKVVLKVSD